MIDLLSAVPATANPSEATVDEIMRDALNCTSAGINAVGNFAKSGLNMYNTMSNMIANPAGMMNQAYNPYSANMGMGQVPQAHYAYAENGTGYGGVSYLNPMNPQQAMGGYPGFANPNYGSMMPQTGFGGFNGGIL